MKAQYKCPTDCCKTDAVEAGAEVWGVEQDGVREEAAGTNQVQVRAGIASVQSADIRNRMSLVNVVSTRSAPNAEQR
jgi:hypothetical protein